MSIIDYGRDYRVLVSVKGHPYPRDAFFGMLESLDDMAFTAVEQPATQRLLSPESAAAYSAVLFYDMPGIDFSTQPPRLVAPAEAFQRDFLELLEQGKGMVFLHHAIAGWPLWPEYAEVVGGRFLYLPGELRGETCPDSGYRHAVDYQARVLAAHPVTDAVATHFSVSDELYLYQVFSESVEPLLASDYCFDREHFFSAQRAVNGQLYSREDWQHPQGSHLIGWVKHYRNSPVVYLQPGDDTAVYDNSEFRRLLHNALRWVGSDAAHEWARIRYQEQRQTADRP
jgi:uncharacterized protein